MPHFYRWTSPPGVMKILCIIIIIMCVAMSACVASTLAWDYDASNMGLGGFERGYGGSNRGYGGEYERGYSGGLTHMNPKFGKFIISAIAGITFIAVLIIFILVVLRQNTAQSPSFYLPCIIICAILAVLMLISTIVYLVIVNHKLQLCAQYQNQDQASGNFLSQYLYHYCVVEPKEAIAVVLGFLVVVGLIILLVFAVKTRGQIRRYGRDRVLWYKVKTITDGLTSKSIGEEANNVSGDPEAFVNDPNDQINRDHIEALEAELKIINQKLAKADRDLNSSREGSPQFLICYAAATELALLLIVAVVYNCCCCC